MMLTYGKLPVQMEGDTVSRPAKYMVNWPGDGNDCYVNLIEMTPEGRAAALDSAKRITLGFVYFIQTELGRRNLGLADDEHPTDDLLPFYPYHRESRRIEGEVLFVVDHAARPYDYTVYRTGIGVGTIRSITITTGIRLGWNCRGWHFIRFPLSTFRLA